MAALTNVTIGSEDHIIIVAENDQSEYSDNDTENRMLLNENDSVNGTYVTNNINGPNNVNTNQKNKHSETDFPDDDLKGEFFVHSQDNENSSINSESRTNSHVMDKNLTLAVCKPTLTYSIPADDVHKHSINGNDRSGGENGDNDAHDEDMGNQNVKFLPEAIDSDAITENCENKNERKCESGKRNGHKNVPIANNCDNQETVRLHLFDRSTPSSQKNIKQDKRRRKPLQVTVPEMDENSEEVGQLDKCADITKGDDRENSINPKTPWKHHNKSNERSKYPIKEDLQVDSSQTRNSVLKRARSALTRPASGRRDVSRLSVGQPNSDEIIKTNKGSREVNSFVSGIPCPIGQDTADPGLLPLSFDYTSSSSNSSQNSSRKNGECASIYQRRYNKLELRKALPRKSFFNCHEKAMKDAGFEIEDPASKRKAERLKAKFERIAREFDPLPSRIVLETGKENSGTVVSSPVDPITEVSNTNGDILSSNDAQEPNDVNVEDMVDAKLKSDSSYPNNSTGKKKRLHPERKDHIDCKPLVHYLEYVKENQSEYESFNTHSSSANVKNKPITRLLSMGRAFELRHRGGSPQTKENDIILMAAKALRPRSSDASRYYKNDQDRTGHRVQDTSLRQIRPMSEDKRRQEKNASTATTSKDDEHAKTEFEKKKIKAEEWAKSVSTNTLTKAKTQSLRELGTEDDELTKWWVALRRCHYLRIKGHTE